MRRNDDEKVNLNSKAKLYRVIAIFVLLGLALSAVSYIGKEVQTGTRAYISGESEWAKAQKEASINLLQYVRTEDRTYYQKYQNALKIIEGDRSGREALMAGSPDVETAREGFSVGENDTEDLDSMIWVFMYFKELHEIQTALSIWEEADRKVQEVIALGADIEEAVQDGGLDQQQKDRFSEEILVYNDLLTEKGHQFSDAMTEASATFNRFTFLLNVFLSTIFIILAAYHTVSYMRHLRRANAKLRRSEHKFRIVLDHSRDVIYQTNIGSSQYEYMSSSVEEMLGIDAEKVMAGGPDMILERVHPDDMQRMKQRQEQNQLKTVEETIVEDSEFRVKRADGSYAWVNNKRAVVHDDDGEPVAIVGNVRDISVHKEQVDKLDQSLNEKQTLLAEIHHRVKNNLAIVSSLIELQKEEVDEELRPAFGTVQARIKSIALIHEKLYENTIFSEVELSDYLRELSSMLSDTYLSQDHDISIDLNLENVKVDMTLAVPVGLICNELINNSFKHAFNEQMKGTVTITLKDLGGYVEVSVADTGKGLPEGFSLDSSQSLGVTLLQVLTQQIRGELEAITDGGSRFILTFPADHEANKKAKKKTGS